MTHTLAAVFETRAEANRAKDELIHSGYDRDAIAVSDSGSVAGTPRINDDASILGNVKQMFSQLLGREHADRHVYAEALNRGHAVLTVETASAEAADRAADIVEEFTPIDIDAHETMWRASGWTGAEVLYAGAGTGAPQVALGAQQSAPEQHGIRQREEAVDFARSEQGLLTPGSQQRGAAVAPLIAEVTTPISEQSTLQRSGMRIYPREAGPNQDSLAILRGDDDEADADYFRSHWEKTLAYSGGTYQEFDPAYRYGESMAGNPGYRDKPWDEAEPELQSTWQSTYPQSSWDKFKAAVKAGWEKVTGG